MTDPALSRAAAHLQSAGVYDLVLARVEAAGFTLEDFLGKARTPKRLIPLRKRVWTTVWEMRTGDDTNSRMFSLNDMATMFNREHTTMLTAIGGRGPEAVAARVATKTRVPSGYHAAVKAVADAYAKGLIEAAEKFVNRDAPLPLSRAKFEAEVADKLGLTVIKYREERKRLGL